MGKVSIYDLYKHEKKVKHRDDKGTEIEVLIVKMNQRERTECLQIYNNEVAKHRSLVENDKQQVQSIARTTSAFTKEQKIDSIITSELAQRDQYSDLIPIEDSESLSPEELTKKRKEATNKWEENRRKEISAMKNDQLDKLIFENIVTSLTIIAGGDAFDQASIMYMVRDSEEKNEKGKPKRIFNTIEDVEEIQDRRVFDWLLDEIKKFRLIESGKAVREVTKDPNFSQTGDSQN